MNAVRRTVVLAAGLSLALTLGACHNDKPCTTNPTGPGCPTTTTTTTLPAQTRTIIGTGSCPDVGIDGLCFFDPFTTSQRGDLDVTLDWTFPEDIIQVLVSNGSCTLDQINASQCTFISSSPQSATPKPRVITIKGVAAGTYQLYAGNRGPKTEAFSVQVGLTTPGTASSAAATKFEAAIGHPYTSQVAAH
jgi:hypothetical protein